MPPRDNKLAEEEVLTIRKWIEAGAPTARPEPENIGRGIGITQEDREFWSFQPIRRPNVPVLENGERARTPVDAFVLAAMQEKSLSFTPDADKLTLLRRACLDLTGLPPTLDEIVSFLVDTSADAYAKMLDRLLQSPHYGERWGRHWLDVAGYADSEGHVVKDDVRDFSYKYRDYVIRALNADKPFDQFLIEQLAGDELVARPHENLSPDQIEKLTATGFLRMVADGTGSYPPDQDIARNQVVADTLKVVSSALLGLSLGCAQCHDHRHDPILQTDYYRIRAIFEPAYDWKAWRVPADRRVSLYTDAQRAEAGAIEAEAAKVASERHKKQEAYLKAALEKELEKVDESRREAARVAYHTAADERTPEQEAFFREFPFLGINQSNLYQFNAKAAKDLSDDEERIKQIRARKPFHDFLRVLTEVPDHVPVTYLFHRGDPQSPKDPIVPGVVTVLTPDPDGPAMPENDPKLPTTGRRLAYARWLVSGRHPLVARVLVNRVWMHHFGRGLVATPSDFGQQGARPSHPKLLDWLASEFMATGWSLKHLHKLIMNSTVYRQSATTDPAKEAIDPGNRLYWRKPMWRLEAETLRDRVLATSGVLNTTMFGPPVPIVLDEVGQIIVAPTRQAEGEPTLEVNERQEHRRSIYVQVRRSKPVSMLQQFDMPVMELNCEKRTSATLSTQALTLMNGDFVLAQAWLLQEDKLLAKDEFAQRVSHDLKPKIPPATPRARAMISLFMHGGPSQVDLLDPKPELSKRDGTSYDGKVVFSFFNRATTRLLRSPWKFHQRGACGTEVSELLPHIGDIVDDICVVRSMHTDTNDHGASIGRLTTGVARPGRPVLGAWVTYGLGSQTQDLPAYVVLTDPGGNPTFGARNWSNGWLPPIYQGTEVRSKKPRIANLQPPPHLRGPVQEQNLAFLQSLNRDYFDRYPAEADLEARIASYELAARMQVAAQEALDISSESEATRRLYGLDDPQTQEYGTRCLIARRLVERGVRFVQLFLPGQPWDSHSKIREGLPRICRKTDKPSAALVKDLKNRGMLETTLVHWGGEFGRLPVSEGDPIKGGRDHNGEGFSTWLAGGGVRGGITYGETCEVGHRAVVNKVSAYDFQATLLHLFGLNHETLTYTHNGQEERLTNNQPSRVVHDILT